MTATRTKQSNGKAPAAKAPAVTEDTPQVEINQIGVERLHVPILGTSPLIVHRFSEKAKRQMLDAMQGRKTPKLPKDPEAEYQAAFYRFADGGYGFPATGFKKATVGGARFYGKDVKMTELRQFMFFVGEIGVDGIQLVRIDGEPQMREDVVRVGNNGADLRYRPEFLQWRAVLDVIYVKSALTRGSVLSLVDAAGMGVGVGEWRPEKHGTSGTYRIDPDREIEVVEVER
jgi:hypothetical protein